MPKNDPSLLSSFQSSFQKLATVAAELNTVSDQLTKSVRELDAAIKSLNPGVECWIEIDTQSYENGGSFTRQLGYAKPTGKWGISLRTIESPSGDPWDDKYTDWLFDEAPRDTRAAAIDSIPRLLDALANEAATTKNLIAAKVEQVRQFASAVTAAVKKEDW